MQPTAKCARTFILTILAGLLLRAQPQRPFYATDSLDSPRIASLKKSIEAGDRIATLTAFWREVSKTTTPLVEPVVGDAQYSWVTFLWQAKENTINVAIIDGVGAAVGGLDPAKALLTHLAGTDVWYRTYKLRNDAAFHYWLSPNDCLELLGGTEARNCKPQADPLNPNRLGPVSYIELPAARPKAALVNASLSLARGKVERTRFHSEILHNDRDIWVYTPPGYEPSSSRYPLLVLFDGADYLEEVSTPTILDNLIAQKRIPPMVAILVGNAMGRREAELACDLPFAEFLASEMVPWMRKNYNATADPSLAIVGGSSRGGLAAAFAGFQHPEVFGNVLSQSGSYWWSPPEETERSWLTRQFARSQLRKVKFSISAGLMEIPDQLDTNRHLRDVLVAKGYSVDYAEFNGNHSYVAWRADFAERLIALIGNPSNR
jgi:enterochelin esterase-like enzyme